MGLAPGGSSDTTLPLPPSLASQPSRLLLLLLLLLRRCSFRGFEACRLSSSPPPSPAGDNGPAEREGLLRLEGNDDATGEGDDGCAVPPPPPPRWSRSRSRWWWWWPPVDDRRALPGPPPPSVVLPPPALYTLFPLGVLPPSPLP